MIVFFHGFENCVANVVASNDAPCGDGTIARDALRMHEQLDAAHVNAILVAVELRFDFASPDPGALAEPGRMRELLDELLGDRLVAPFRCQLTPADFERVVIVAHSGGYQAAAAALTVGDVPNVREVVLLDSLYSELPAFAQWITTNAPRFDRTRDDTLRFVDAYTCCAGTADNTRVLASIVASSIDAKHVFDDPTPADAPRDDLDAPIVFKLVDRVHGDVPKEWIRTVAEHAGFTPLPEQPSASRRR
jgi:hypothetical protein